MIYLYLYLVFHHKKDFLLLFGLFFCNVVIMSYFVIPNPNPMDDRTNLIIGVFTTLTSLGILIALVRPNRLDQD